MATGIGQYGFGAKMHRYATAGKYFTATNTTPGTGIISAVSTTLDDTKPTLLLKNNNTVASGIVIVPDYLKLHVTVVGIGHTAPKITIKTDTSQSTTRYSSGGSTITPVGCSADAVSQAQVYFGAITAAAAGNARTIDTFLLASAIEVVNDTWIIDFGQVNHGFKTALLDNTTTLTHGVVGTAPVSIGPQEHLAIHFWAASISTGTTFAFTLGYIEA